MQAFNSSQYEANPLLGSAGVAISREFTRVEGRVLTAPQVFSLPKFHKLVPFGDLLLNKDAGY